MENAGHGGSEAAPIAGALLSTYFHEDEADSVGVPVEIPEEVD